MESPQEPTITAIAKEFDPATGLQRMPVSPHHRFTEVVRFTKGSFKTYIRDEVTGIEIRGRLATRA